MTTGRRWLQLALAIGVVWAAYYGLTHAASSLVVHDPAPSDVILVLAGSGDDSRFWRALEMMKEGYAPRLVLDVESPAMKFGRSNADLAQEFLAKNGAGRSQVCEISGDSTFDETVDVARCLKPLQAHSVLIVTSDYHTRRAVTIFRKRLPQYQWHIAAASAPREASDPWMRTADEWWKNRRWAKSMLDEWQKWTWWILVDRWRARPVVAA